MPQVEFSFIANFLFPSRRILHLWCAQLTNVKFQLEDLSEHRIFLISAVGSAYAKTHESTHNFRGGPDRGELAVARLLTTLWHWATPEEDESFIIPLTGCLVIAGLVFVVAVVVVVLDPTDYFKLASRLQRHTHTVMQNILCRNRFSLMKWCWCRSLVATRFLIELTNRGGCRFVVACRTRLRRSKL